MESYRGHCLNFKPLSVEKLAWRLWFCAVNSSARWWDWVRGRKYHQPHQICLSPPERPVYRYLSNAIGPWQHWRFARVKRSSTSAQRHRPWLPCGQHGTSRGCEWKGDWTGCVHAPIGRRDGP